jgi:hypothetical protein
MTPRNSTIEPKSETTTTGPTWTPWKFSFQHGQQARLAVEKLKAEGYPAGWPTEQPKGEDACVVFALLDGSHRPEQIVTVGPAIGSHVEEIPAEKLPEPWRRKLARIVQLDQPEESITATAADLEGWNMELADALAMITALENDTSTPAASIVKRRGELAEIVSILRTRIERASAPAQVDRLRNLLDRATELDQAIRDLDTEIVTAKDQARDQLAKILHPKFPPDRFVYRDGHNVAAWITGGPDTLEGAGVEVVALVEKRAALQAERDALQDQIGQLQGQIGRRTSAARLAKRRELLARLEAEGV